MDLRRLEHRRSGAMTMIRVERCGRFTIWAMVVLIVVDGVSGTGLIRPLGDPK